MWNFKKAKKSEFSPADKTLLKSREKRQNTAVNPSPITDKQLEPQHAKDNRKPTEGQFEKRTGTDNKITEKQMKREKVGELYVPAINSFVDQLVQERREVFTKMQKNDKEDWTLAPTTQNGDLPAWPQVKLQHDKTVLPNDVDRKEDEPLIGGKILSASIDNAVSAIKTGKTLNYDEQIVNILKKANVEKRDLNDSEKKNIAELKIKRSKEYIKEN